MSHERQLVDDKHMMHLSKITIVALAMAVLAHADDATKPNDEGQKPFVHEGPLALHAQGPDVIADKWQVLDSLFIDDPQNPPRDQAGQLTKRAVAMADVMIANKLKSVAFVSYGPEKDEGFLPHVVGIQVIVHESPEACADAWAKRWETVGAGDNPLAVAIEDVGDAAWRYANPKMPKLAVRVGNVWFESDATKAGDEHARLMIAYLKSLGCPTPKLEQLLPPKEAEKDAG